MNGLSDWPSAPISGVARGVQFPAFVVGNRNPLAPDPAVFATLLLVFGAFFALLPVVSALRPVPQTDPFYV